MEGERAALIFFLIRLINKTPLDIIFILCYNLTIPKRKDVWNEL